MHELSEFPHRRFNPLIGEWVLVSPHRAKRPWRGKIENPPIHVQATYDPECYLCAGNARAGGVCNPDYKSTFIFDNDFAGLLPNAPPCDVNENDLLVAKSEQGICRVMCFHERHDLTLATMTEPQVNAVVDDWVGQYHELARISWVNHVQIFENRGEIMGASNPHPHCQIWATASVPNQAEKENRSQLHYRQKHRSCLLCDYLVLELQCEERIICRNADFVVIVPFWAIWPFEVMLVSTRHLGAMDELNQAEKKSLADILRRMCIRYDNLFEVPFPYTMGFHQKSTDGQEHPECHFHAHYYPPLLRSATIPKFMVGYEMLGTPQCDLTPEAAAERLRALSEVHYREAKK